MNDDDHLIEASAQQAMRIAKEAQLDRTQRDASGAGFVASQITDGAMNNGKSYSGAASGPSDVLAREQAASRAAVQTRRVIESMGDLDLNDLFAPDLGQQNEQGQTARALSRMTQHMVNSSARRIINDAYMDPNEASMLVEQEAYRPQQVDSGWRVKKTQAKLQSGKLIPVFMVEDSLSGMTTGKKYRLSQVAAKIAKVMNVTQNPNDARIKMIETAYDRHVDLMRAIAGAKTALTEGRGDRRKLQQLESELQEVNARLGL
jgi:hypothetical protein